jgi:hypothetical protein
MPAEAAGQVEMAVAPDHELAGKDVASAENESKASEPAAQEKGKKGEKEAKPKYSMHTGDQVAVWFADTEVEFVLHGKRPGTKSYDRYEKYSQAKTIKGVLDAGAKPEDLLHDFEKKLFKVTGGPVREAKLNPATITDASGFNDTDIILIQLLNKCQRPEGSDPAPALAKINQLKFSKKFGVDTTALRKGNWCESSGMMAERLRAAETAAKILSAAETEKRKITSDDVLQVLRLWRFRRNGTRVDVMPEGTKTISCDRLGVQRKNGEDVNIASQETIHYPALLKLFARWLKDNRPDGMDFDLPFTSVFVNAEYAARRHRDKANVGPTVVASFGDFTDGRLGYWAEDDKSLQVPQLDDDDKQMLDIRNTATLIDGNRAHAVEEWLGTDRFSLVFYVLDHWEATSDELKQQLVEAGCVWPTEASLRATQSLLPAPKGYTEADVAAPRRTLFKLEGDTPSKSIHKKDGGADQKKDAGKAVKKTVLKHTGSKSPFSIATTRPAEHWTSETRLVWLEGKEGAAPQSVDRHKKYSAAATVGEALSLGARPTDLLHDFEVRLMKPNPRGPVRTGPLRLVHVRDRNALDKYLMSMKTPLDARASGLKFMSSMGRRMTGGAERVDQSGQKRETADKLAAAMLKDAEATGRRITDREIHEVLARWTFHRNEARQNVLPDGATFVYSDTLGLVHTRTGSYAATRATKDYRNVVRLLTRWIKDRKPAELEHDFPFTSISLNAGYAAKRHRDGNNAGPSMIHAFGRFQGGQLGYWPEDNKSSALENLLMKDRATFDLAKDLVLFDGNRAHEVDDFQGERFSVVYYTTKGYDQIPEDQQAILRDCGFPLPTAEDLNRVWPLLPKPRGYEGQSLEKFFEGGAAAVAAPPKLYTWQFPSNPEEEKAVAAVIKAADRPEVAPPVSPEKTQNRKAMVAPKSGQKGKKPVSAKAKLARLWGGPLGLSMKKAAAAPPQQKSKPQEKGLKRKADGAEADALEKMQEGLASLVKAAKSSEGGAAGAAARLRPQLMKHMQEVLRFAGSE